MIGPAEPAPTSWVFPSSSELAALPTHGRSAGTDHEVDPDLDPDPDGDPDVDDGYDDSDLIALGADLAPGTVLAAYRAGLFPMPEDRSVGWWCPAHRGVLRLADLKVSRSLRRSARTMEIRVDTAFDEVLAACADPARPHGWIDRHIMAAYTELHHLGWAHSVEAWRDGRLIGGLYGLAIGGLFAGESMFHRETDASKVALLGLVEGLAADAEGAAGRRLIDVQWATSHLRSLGVRPISRRAYLDELPALLAVPPSPFWSS